MKTLLISAFICLCIAANAQNIKLEFISSQFVKHLDPYIRDGNFGGISGVEYVQAQNKWYLISDGIGPWRQSYVFEIDGSATGGFPDWQKPKGLLRHWLGHVRYAEAIRFNGRNLWFVTEEETKETTDVAERGKVALLDPLTWYSGKAAHTYTSQNDNRGIEAICFDDNGHLITLNEWPCIKDTPYSRLNIFDYTDSTSNLVATYAYPLDIRFHRTPVAAPDQKLVNGVTDILPIGPDDLLVLERSYTTSNAVRLFRATKNASTSNVLGVSENDLKSKKDIVPLEKKLVFDFGSIPGVHADNLEGMCWGPDRKSLVFISDNNFSESQTTQWIILKVVD